MSTEIVAPQPHAGQCISPAEASQIVHGVYPPEGLDARLDHADRCLDCTGMFRTIVALVVAHLERAEAQAP